MKKRRCKRFWITSAKIIRSNKRKWIDILGKSKNKVEDIDQLNNYQQQKQDEVNDLLKKRQGSYYQRLRARTIDEKEKWLARAKLFTPEIKKLRLQIKACENIRNRSFDKDIERIAQKKIKLRDAR